ncbi:early nodulin-like protein 2 [Cajanus cajan]|uniref:Early nodulin-like protein 2 n=1 Tax=Cajanus cajan TaxID=3821 RepID=A0A151SH90_CAJCA|nr:early nodulin-like protein 2 [Cajanus cajan]KYP54162.1 Early nodulin-like protein 2 [Cajanus cajan]
MNTNMASLLSILCVAWIVVLAVMDTPVEGAKQFKVGWHEPNPNDTAFYNQWAAWNRFQVGDSLVFEYQNDTVLNVEKWEYFHCDSNDPINTFDDGNSTVILDSPGAFYFISGTEDHCQNGQKLIVEVMSPHTIPNSPPPISIPPQGSSPLSPPTSHSSGVSSSIMALFTTFLVLVLLLAS